MTTVQNMPIDPELARRLRASATNLERARERRNQLIAQAVAEGGSLREVGALVGLSHTQVRHISETEASP